MIYTLNHTLLDMQFLFKICIISKNVAWSLKQNEEQDEENILLKQLLIQNIARKTIKIYYTIV